MTQVNNVVTEDKSELVKQFMLASDTLANIKKTTDMLLTQMADQDQLAAEEVTAVLSVINYEDLVALMAPKIEALYTAAELKELVDFLNTPIGKKMIAIQPQLGTDCYAVMVGYFESKQGEMKAALNTVLQARLAAISKPSPLAN